MSTRGGCSLGYGAKGEPEQILRGRDAADRGLHRCVRSRQHRTHVGRRVAPSARSLCRNTVRTRDNVAGWPGRSHCPGPRPVFARSCLWRRSRVAACAPRPHDDKWAFAAGSRNDPHTLPAGLQVSPYNVARRGHRAASSLRVLITAIHACVARRRRGEASRQWMHQGRPVLMTFPSPIGIECCVGLRPAVRKTPRSQRTPACAQADLPAGVVASDGMAGQLRSGRRGRRGGDYMAPRETLAEGFFSGSTRRVGARTERGARTATRGRERRPGSAESVNHFSQVPPAGAIVGAAVGVKTTGDEGGHSDE